MKRAIFLLGFLVLFPGQMICQSENHLTRFRIPKTSATNLVLLWNINLSGNLNTYSQESLNRFEQFSSTVIPHILFDHFSESEPLQMQLFSESRNLWTYDKQKNADVNEILEDKYTTSLGSRNLFNFSLNWYPASWPASLYLHSITIIDYTDSKAETK